MVRSLIGAADDMSWIGISMACATTARDRASAAFTFVHRSAAGHV
jgi:hypothetical protein